MTAGIDYLLHLADNALVLGQRNAEWCGNGPVLEEDIALANISLDLVGQARLLYQHAALLKADGSTEDSLAYFRGAGDFLNYTLLELPHGVVPPGAAGGTGAVGGVGGVGQIDEARPAEVKRDYAVTIVRNFLYSAWMLGVWQALLASKDSQLAAIAERSVKEVRYHLRHSRDWLLRLGDGTVESSARTQAALDHFMPYVPEFWAYSAIEKEAIDLGIGVDPQALKQAWLALAQGAVSAATLHWPDALAANAVALPQGKNRQHSPYLSRLLQEMQGLARAHPGASW